MEAKQNPNKKLVIGQKVMTYRELASKIDGARVPKPEAKLINSFVQSSITLFETNPTFKAKMLELASPVNT